MWYLNNKLLNNQWIAEEIRGHKKKKKKLETDEIRSTLFQILWEVAKTTLSGSL